MNLKDIRGQLKQCEVFKSGKGFVVLYPVKNESNTKNEIKDLTEYIEQNATDTEVVDVKINYIHYYKGRGVKNSSHYAVKLKVIE